MYGHFGNFREGPGSTSRVINPCTPPLPPPQNTVRSMKIIILLTEFQNMLDKINYVSIATVLTCSTSTCRRGYLMKSSGHASIHRPISLKTLSCSGGINEVGVVFAFGDDDELDLSSIDQSKSPSGSG